MGFFSFLGESLSPGYEPMAKAEAAALENHKRRRAIPYELADMRSAASDRRVAAIDNVKDAEYRDKREALYGQYKLDTTGMTGQPDFNARVAAAPATPVQAIPQPASAAASGQTEITPPPMSVRMTDPDFMGDVLGYSPEGNLAADIRRAMAQRGLDPSDPSDMQSLLDELKAQESATSSTTNPNQKAQLRTLINQLEQDIAAVGRGLKPPFGVRKSSGGRGSLPATATNKPDPAAEAERLLKAYNAERDPYLKAQLWQQHLRARRAVAQGKFRNNPLVDDINTAIDQRPTIGPDALTSYKEPGAPTQLRSTSATDREEAVQRAAQVAGVSPAYIQQLIARESSGQNVKNPNSSAMGVAQFMPKTAKQYNLDPSDPIDSIRALGELTRDNKARWKKKFGSDPTDAELYLMHQQGASGAFKLLEGTDKTAAEIVGEDAVRLNGGNLNMSGPEFAGSVKAYYSGEPLPQALTPAEAAIRTPGQPGFNIRAYQEDPSRIPFDLQQLAQTNRLIKQRIDLLNADPARFDPEARVSQLQEMGVLLLQNQAAELMTHLQQGLIELMGNDGRRFNLALSELTATQIEVIPHGNGQYSLAINGQLATQEPTDYDGIYSLAMQIADPAYRATFVQSQTEGAADIAKIYAQGNVDAYVEGVKASVGTQRDAVKSMLDTESQIAIERAKAQLNNDPRFETRSSDTDSNPVYYDRETRKLYRLVLQNRGMKGNKQPTPVLEEVISE